MRIGSGKEFVEITEIERVPQGVPDAGDVRVSVEVKLGEFGEFGGRYDSIWLEASALMCFVNELKVAENCRQGGASLQSMSPDEFRLHIQSRDAVGHFAVEVLLSRHHHSGPANRLTSVSGGFEIDPDSLPAVLNAFKALSGSD